MADGDVPATPVPTNVPTDDTGPNPTPMSAQLTPPSPASGDPPTDPPKESEGDYALKKEYELYKENQKRAEENDPKHWGYYNEMNTINARLQQANPQVPQYRPYLTLAQFQQQQNQADQQARQQSGRNISTVIGQVLSIAAIAGAVFGRNKNPWAKAGLMSGAGQFMTNFANGQKQAAKDQMELWSKNNELIQKQNELETKDYHDILADRRLDLSEQMALTRDLAARRHDYEMYLAASKNSLNEVTKLLAAKQKALTATAKAHLDVVSRMMKEHPELGTAAGKGWAQYVQEKTGINPLSSEEEFKKAYAKYSISEWMSGWKNIGKTTTTYEGGKPVTHTFTADDVYKEAEKGGVGKAGDKTSEEQKKAFQDLGIDHDQLQ